MTTYNEDFAYASSGSIVANTNNTLDEVNGTCTYATAPSGRTGNCGSMSGVCYLGYSTDIAAPILGGSGGWLYFRAYVYFDSANAAWAKICGAEDQQGAYLLNGWQTTGTANQLRLMSLSSNSGTQYTFSTGTWYRLEVDVDYTNKTVAGRIYEGDSTSAVSTQSATWTTIARTNVNGQCDKLLVRRDTTGVTYVDDFAWSKDAQPGSSYVAPSMSPGQLNARIAVGA